MVFQSGTFRSKPERRTAVQTRPQFAELISTLSHFDVTDRVFQSWLDPAINPGQVIMPNMGKQIRLRLDSVDVGQLLDGLRLRAESWRKTAEFLESGYAGDDAFICEECNSAYEATCIAEHYNRIVVTIETQVTDQGGW